MYIQWVRRQLFIIVFAVIVFLAASSNTAAQTAEKTAGIEIAPAFIEISLETPGQTKEITLDITNHSNKTVSLRMFPIDFKQWDETGRITFFTNTPGTFSYSLASFLSFESGQLILGPSEKRQFSVAVTNRDDLSPGGHYAAIVGTVADENISEVTRIAPAVSSLVLLRKVGGERFHLSLKEVNWINKNFTYNYPSSMELVFQNEGNIHMVPYGKVEVRDIFSRLLYKGIVNTSSTRVFPESRRLIEVNLKKVDSSWPISINTVDISGEDSLKKAKFTYREYFIYINPVFIAFSLVGISLLIFGLVRLKRRSKGI